MPNSIKSSGEGLALQVTREARSAGLVEENTEGEPTRLANVRVYNFTDLALVVDRDSKQLTTDEIAAHVAELTSETRSIYQAIDASVQPSGNGYLVQLPAIEDTGLRKGDEPVCRPAPQLLVIHRDREGPASIARTVVQRRKRRVNG